MVRPREGARLPELRETSDGLTDRKNNICDRIPAFTPGYFCACFLPDKAERSATAAKTKKKRKILHRKLLAYL